MSKLHVILLTTVVASSVVAQCPPSASYASFSGWSTTPLLNVPATNPYATGPVATGGNGGDAWSVAQSVFGGVVGAQIYLAHLEPTAVPLPPSGLAHVSLSVDASMTAQSPAGAFGNVVGFQFCVEQGGVVHSAPSTYSLVFINAGYGTRSFTGLTASHFVSVDGLGAHPDFTAGGPVRFGFTTGNGNTNGGQFTGGVGTTTSSYDNFTVTFAPAAGAVSTVPGCGVASPPIFASTAPAFGSFVALSLSNAAPSTPAGLFTSFPPAAPLALGGGCLLGLDLASLTEFALFTTDAGGGWSLGFTMPAVCALSGAAFAFQALVLDPAATGGFALSNAVVVVVGA